MGVVQVDCTSRVVEQDCEALGTICDLPRMWLKR